MAMARGESDGDPVSLIGVPGVSVVVSIGVIVLSDGSVT